MFYIGAAMGCLTKEKHQCHWSMIFDLLLTLEGFQILTSVQPKSSACVGVSKSQSYINTHTNDEYINSTIYLGTFKTAVHEQLNIVPLNNLYCTSFFSFGLHHPAHVVPGSLPLCVQQYWVICSPEIELIFSGA